MRSEGNCAPLIKKHFRNFWLLTSFRPCPLLRSQKRKPIKCRECLRAKKVVKFSRFDSWRRRD